MVWGELVQGLSFLIFALILLVFLYKCSQIKKKLEKKRKDKNTAYVRTKEIVTEYLNEKEAEDQLSRFENILEVTKSVIIHRLMSSSIQWCCPKQVWEDEEALKTYLEAS